MEDLARRVADVEYWYHTMDLAPGVVTPGHFDMRDGVGRLPWPDLAGKRCLDVATFDGFYAFEMERRGAAEVVAIDLPDLADMDWLPREVPPDHRRGREVPGPGFALAKEALGSAVERVVCNVYDLTPEVAGTFDVVVCGSLLQHLRDPMGALARVRSVCEGVLLSVEHVDAFSSLFWWHTPTMRLVGHDRTWMLPNVRGHHRLLFQSGFDVEQARRVPLALGSDVWNRPIGWRVRSRRLVHQLWWRLLGGSGDPTFSAIIARPAAGLHPLAPRS